jgi:hypothetical protein
MGVGPKVFQKSRWDFFVFFWGRAGLKGRRFSLDLKKAIITSDFKGHL